MIRRLSAVVIAALLVVAFAVPAQAGGERSRHEQIVAYWTAERLASAIPRDFVRGTDGFRPAARPQNPGKPGGGGGGNVTGASWTGDPFFARVTGKAFFTMAGTRYVCSGSIVHDGRSTHSLVLTAGHCAYDETNGGFATNWLFIPNYDAAPAGQDCGATLYGCWTASGLVVHEDYTTAGGFNQQATLHDWAFAVVGPGGHGATQLDALGFVSISTGSPLADGTRVHAFGYPAAQKYKGNDLVYCAGPTFSDPYNGELTYGLTCDMTGGSSGGPWIRGVDQSGDDAYVSVNSYGYSGVKAMHGPKFNAETNATYQSANTATGDRIVP